MPLSRESSPRPAAGWRRFVAVGLAIAFVAGTAALVWSRGDARSAPEPVAAVQAGERFSSAFEAACHEAARSGRDVLVWCRRRSLEDLGTSLSTRATEALGNVSLRREIERQFVVIELPYDDAISATTLPESLQPFVFPSFTSVIGFGNAGSIRRTPLIPVLLLSDPDGRVYEDASRAVNDEFFVDVLADLRTTRELRDRAFRRASFREGRARARALADGLAELEPRIVALCHRDVLEEIAELDPDGAGAELAPTLRAARALPGVMAVHEVALPFLMGETHPSRGTLLRVLRPVMRLHENVREVQQLARMYLATISPRAQTSSGVAAAARAELEEAIELDPESQVAAMMKGMLAEFDQDGSAR